jgi:flagellar biosynthesis GTPase FlhF
MTAKKSDERKQQQTSKSAKHVHKRNEQRRSASTQKHESASLAHQLLPPLKTRAATLQTKPAVGRDEDAVEGKASLGQATNNRPHEQRHLHASSSTLHTPQSRAQYIYRRRSPELVAHLHRMHRRSLFASPKDPREVVDGALHQEEATMPRQGRQHELSIAPVMRTDLTRVHPLRRGCFFSSIR